MSNPNDVIFSGHTILDIDKEANVKFAGKIIINSGVFSAIDNSVCSKIYVRKGAVLELGNMSGMSNTVIQCYKSIVIGDYVKIGAGSMIFDSNFHSIDWQTRADASLDCECAKSLPIVIGDHVFIGAHSIIMKGVTIGARSVIAGGSVVVNDIPSDCIAGGNPCKIIKYI